MDNILRSVPVGMVAELLNHPEKADAARASVVLSAARKRIDDLRAFLADDLKRISDPLNPDLEAAEMRKSEMVAESIELEKLQNAIPLLETLHAEKLESEAAARLASQQADAKKNRENLLVEFDRLAVHVPALKAIYDQLVAANAQCGDHESVSFLIGIDSAGNSVIPYDDFKRSLNALAPLLDPETRQKSKAWMIERAARLAEQCEREEAERLKAWEQQKAENAERARVIAARQKENRNAA